MTEDDTERLRYPAAWLWRVRVGIAGSALIAGVGISDAIFSPPSDPVQVRWLVGVAAGAIAAFAALLGYHRLLSSGVLVSPEGLAQVRGGRTIRGLTWSEIDRIRARKVLGRLEFRSGLGRGTIVVDEHLDGYDWLIKLAERRTGRTVERRWF